MTQGVVKRMAWALLLVLALVAMSGSEARALSARAGVARIIIEESVKAGVPPSLTLAIAKVESDFVSSAKSHVGARGVMQMMPSTARGEFGIKDSDKLWNARTNIRLGIEFLGKLYRQYGGVWSFVLSHYNGGTLKKRKGKWVAHSYTRGYVNKVLSLQRRYQNHKAIKRIESKRTFAMPMTFPRASRSDPPKKRSIIKRTAAAPAPAEPSAKTKESPAASGETGETAGEDAPDGQAGADDEKKNGE